MGVPLSMQVAQWDAQWSNGPAYWLDFLEVLSISDRVLALHAGAICWALRRRRMGAQRNMDPPPSALLTKA